MKFYLVLILSLTGLILYAQDSQDFEMVLMTDTYTRQAPYGMRYYKNGETKPFTGKLYGRYDNGELLTVQEYVDGIGNGTWTQYNPDGSISEQGTYQNNRVEGPVTQYYDDGSIKAKGQYRHWKSPIGEWTYYDRAGNVVHRMTYTP